eukprot:420584_1
MKLLSHNHLLCLNKNCKSNDALIIDPKKVVQIESEPKLSFMIHILSMIDYNVLLAAAKQIGIKDLPLQLPSKEIIQKSESFLRSMQKVLLDSNVTEGRLICSKCQTSYLISNGVVDMMHPQINNNNNNENENENENDNNDNNDNEIEENKNDNDGNKEYEEDIDMNNFLNEEDQQLDDNNNNNNNDNNNNDNDLQQNENEIEIDDVTNNDKNNEDMIDID